MMSRLPLAVLAACLWSGIAQAQNYTKLSGADVDFYYDSSVISSPVSVSGNTLTLADGWFGNFIAVPHANFLVNNSVSMNVYGTSYNASYNNTDFGYYNVSGTATADAGTFVNGAFHAGQAAVSSVDVNQSGTYSTGYYAPNEYGYYDFVPYGGTVNLGASATSGVNNQPGYFSHALLITFASDIYSDGGMISTNAAFRFDGVPAPVPEPETYAFLLAGLGMIAYAARRKAGGRA